MHRLLITSLLALPVPALAATHQPTTEPATQPADRLPAFVHEPTGSYTDRTMHGFRVRVSAAAISHPETTTPALELLERKLAEAIELTPAHTHPHLRKVTIWVEHNAPEHGAACYHPGRQWLVDNGFNPDKERGVEIANTANFVSWTEQAQPLMVLHELAHAYHHQVLGFDNRTVIARYENALARGTYDKVEHISGESRRHYALTNEREYFAELTESYFGTNDFFPFTREQLRAHDPAGLEMIEALWLRPPEKKRTIKP